MWGSFARHELVPSAAENLRTITEFVGRQFRYPLVKTDPHHNINIHEFAVIRAADGKITPHKFPGPETDCLSASWILALPCKPSCVILEVSFDCDFQGG